MRVTWPSSSLAASTGRPAPVTAATRRAARRALVDAPAAEVTLRRPPPLETPLAVARGDGGVALLDGDDVVAEARAAALALDGPPPVALDERPPRPSTSRGSTTTRSRPASAAAPARPGRRAVPLHRPGRRRALRRALDAAGVDAATATWSIRCFAWAALDCPSSAPGPRHDQRARGARALDGRARGPDRGRLATRDPVLAGTIRRAQAPHRGALFTAAGERRAAGRAVWVELARPLGA